MFKEVGWDMPDDHYTNSPLWTEVVVSAQEVWKVLIQNEEVGYDLRMEEYVQLVINHVKKYRDKTPRNPQSSTVIPVTFRKV